MQTLDPIPPGEILLEEFLNPMGLSRYRLAKEIGVPAQRISEIVAGKRSVTADTDLRLCRFFGLSGKIRDTSPIFRTLRKVPVFSLKNRGSVLDLPYL
ncbi:HigA family addiction module antitoxin [Desulfobulbus alkaliphilus]|uniref:HigA family addiction module antitoxin n=1 Tax=Desulfobulbus alkaliphilus TaxID=869814 RepID=UPI001966B597|nr:HigA family addiction module antitoxin [Desulfobulbus alkaliphilus]MBM9537085.1 HigA family addiction module antidote protein [Desulfobulbus alkaliphilus]